jgi:hypothetical protein
MFAPTTIPFGAVMLFNPVKLKEGVSPDDVPLALGEMCNVVKNTCGDEAGGFIGGQVFEYTGFISGQDSFDATRMTEDHLVIVSLSGERRIAFPSRLCYANLMRPFPGRC